jgi:hypothetical protein
MADPALTIDEDDAVDQRVEHAFDIEGLGQVFDGGHRGLGRLARRQATGCGTACGRGG